MARDDQLLRLARAGVGIREAARALKIAPGTAASALKRLESEGRLHSQPLGPKLVFHAPGAKVQLPLDANLKRLHLWLETHGPVIQKVILDFATTWGWARSTTQHRLEQLERLQLVESKWRHGHRYYYCREAVSER